MSLGDRAAYPHLSQEEIEKLQMAQRVKRSRPQTHYPSCSLGDRAAYPHMSEEEIELIKSVDEAKRR